MIDRDINKAYLKYPNCLSNFGPKEWHQKKKGGDRKKKGNSAIN